MHTKKLGPHCSTLGSGWLSVLSTGVLCDDMSLRHKGSFCIKTTQLESAGGALEGLEGLESYGVAPPPPHWTGRSEEMPAYM